MMTYQETLDFMFAQLPMYHRIGAAAYKADIQPTIDMMEALGHPERKFKSIHVAGTNGKGSVSHFLASILQEAGYKVGLYTSPHLVDFRERIRINGEMIPQSAVVDFVDKYFVKSSTPSPLRGTPPDPGGELQGSSLSTPSPLRGTPPVPGGEQSSPVSSAAPLQGELSEGLRGKMPENLSFFEMTVGMAFDYFACEHVDIAVIEVGMGGRLDSTNVITPLLSIITNIGLDHTQFLGDTLEKIAGEKAGIIKEGVPVVIGETQPETAPVFLAAAEAHHAPITFADQHYQVDDIGRYTKELTGEYQKKNIATVLEAVEVLRNTFHFPLSPFHLQRGLARVVTNTHLHGRWQKIGEAPLTICETAHNEPGIRAMLQGIANTPHRNLHLIYGCVNDKDYAHILSYLNSELLGVHGGTPLPNSKLTWYFTQPSVPRGLPVAQLQAAAEAIGIHGEAYERVGEAIIAARQKAQPNDLVLVTGSIFLVADALAFTNNGEVSV